MHEMDSVTVIHGEVSRENMEWDLRSDVGECSKPFNFKTVSESLYMGKRGIQEVRMMGTFLALITFISKEAMD